MNYFIASSTAVIYILPDFWVFVDCSFIQYNTSYIPIDEGWLFVAAVMDLCGRKIFGMSMDSTMTKRLIIEALNDAVLETLVVFIKNTC